MNKLILTEYISYINNNKIEETYQKYVEHKTPSSAYNFIETFNEIADDNNDDKTRGLIYENIDKIENTVKNIDISDLSKVKDIDVYYYFIGYNRAHEVDSFNDIGNCIQCKLYNISLNKAVYMYKGMTVSHRDFFYNYSGDDERLSDIADNIRLYQINGMVENKEYIKTYNLLSKYWQRYHNDIYLSELDNLFEKFGCSLESQTIYQLSDSFFYGGKFIKTGHDNLPEQDFTKDELIQSRKVAEINQKIPLSSKCPMKEFDEINNV